VLLPEATVPVTVILPDLPLHWAELFSGCTFDLSWSSEEREKARAGDLSRGTLLPGSRLVIELPRAPPIPIIATPSCDGIELAPAGALWPLHTNRDGSLNISFAEGPAAVTLRQAAAAGADISNFPIRRFSDAIRTHLPDDPWRLDIGRVARAIAGRSMRESYIRPAELFPVDGLPPPGSWIAHSPFLTAITEESGWPDLPVGLHRFVDGSGRRVYVELDPEGRSWTSR